jgi:hypothetical protein
MKIARKVPGPWISARLFIAAAVLLPGIRHAKAESEPPAAPEPRNVRELSGHFPEKPSMAPVASIPLEPLGFASPGQNYIGMRNTMVSLDFLGENRLLFTFRVPGLMRREPGSTAEDQRQIRAVVLDIPSGNVQAETNWTVHDRWRYIWPLDDGHFFLRDRNTIYQVDTALNRKPLLQFPGALLSLQLNPGGQYLLTNSREPSQVASQAGSSNTRGSNDHSWSAVDQGSDIVLRILRRESSQVMLVTHVHNPVQLPFNSEGYLSALRDKNVDWMVTLSYFTGQERTLGEVKSACSPDLDFLSEEQALVTACSDSGSQALIGMSMAGAKLWTDLETDKQVWPIISASRDGSRFARESLYTAHPVDTFNPMGNEDIKGQWVQVFDSATGVVAFESPTTPILDAGGNVAISPSGRRVALLNAGAIQIFDLPGPPPSNHPGQQR